MFLVSVAAVRQVKTELAGAYMTGHGGKVDELRIDDRLMLSDTTAHPTRKASKIKLVANAATDYAAAYPHLDGFFSDLQHIPHVDAEVVEL